MQLKGQVVIATFVKGSLIVEAKKAWVEDLVLLVQPGRILWHREARRGFVYVKTNKVETAQLLIHRTHQFSKSTALYQPLIVGFSPNRPQGVFLPTWFSFCLLPLEFFPVSRTIALQLGQVLAEGIPVDATKDHRFCVAMDIS